MVDLNKGKEKAQEIKKDLEKKAVHFRREAKANLEKARKDLKIAEKKVEEYMKKNPAKAAGIAAGVGAIVGVAIGALLGRKKK